MKNEVAINIQKPDYSFMFKNYLDKNIWGEKYTIYVYKDFIATIELESINVKEKALTFRISHNYLNSSFYNDWRYEYVKYFLDHPEYTLKIFEKEVQGKVRNAFKEYFGKKNFEQTHRILRERDQKIYNELEHRYESIIDEYYDDLPYQIQSMIYKSDLFDNFLKKCGFEWTESYDYSHEHYEQELKVFDGVSQIINNLNYGEELLEQEREKLEDILNNGSEEEIVEYFKEEYEIDLELDEDEILEMLD